MANPTTYFGWVMPTSTDLVTDLPADFNIFGQGVDTSMQKLLGGTTGQVLSKASGTNMDFTWVAQDDSNAIQNAIVDAKGDLIAATAADTPARLGVGTNGQVLTADSTAGTGLAWSTISAGGMTLLSTTTLSGATTTISSISQDYINLYLEITNINPSVDMEAQIKPNNTANLCYAGRVYNYGGTAGTEGAGSNANIPIAQMDAANTDNCFAMMINTYTSTAAYKPISWYGYAMHSTVTNTSGLSGGGIKTNSAITSLVFLTNAGVFNGGTVKLYGVK